MRTRLRLGGFLAFFLLASTAWAAPTARRPNVIFILVDTLRADHLGCYGFKGANITPNMDTFAKEGLLFEKCATAATWTKPSITSLFTSLYPQTHGIVRALSDDKTKNLSKMDILPASAVTMAESFKKTGYRTVEVIANPWIKPETGLAQGFKEYIYAEKSRLMDTAIGWIKDNPSAKQKKPVFVYIHTLDVHGNYVFSEEDFQEMKRVLDYGNDVTLTPEDKVQIEWYMEPTFKEHPERWSSVLNWRAAYAAGVKRFDGRFGELMEAIKDAGYLSNSIIVLTSDHGEGLWQHGWLEHGKTVHIEEVHVPLIVRLPNAENAGRRFGSWMSLIDVFPTLADLCRLDTMKAPMQGVSLASGIFGGPLPKRRMYTESFMLKRNQKSVIEENMHLIAMFPDAKTTKFELYDMAADAGEWHDIAGSRPGEVERLHEFLARHIDLQNEGQPLPKKQIPMTPEMEEQLRSLGYLQ